MVCLAASVVPPALAPIETRKINLNALNTLIFEGTIDPASADAFIAALVGKRAMLSAYYPNEELYIIINSGGGDYFDAKTMREVISKSPNTTLICKYCGSAAGFIFATTPNVKRLVFRNSSLLMHEMYIPKLTAEDAKNQWNLTSLIEDSDEFNAAMYTKIGISKADYEKKIIDKEWTVWGQEIVNLHLADELIKVSCNTYVNRMMPTTCKEE